MNNKAMFLSFFLLTMLFTSAYSDNNGSEYLKKIKEQDLTVSNRLSSAELLAIAKAYPDFILVTACEGNFDNSDSQYIFGAFNKKKRTLVYFGLFKNSNATYRIFEISKANFNKEDIGIFYRDVYGMEVDCYSPSRKKDSDILKKINYLSAKDVVCISPLDTEGRVGGPISDCYGFDSTKDHFEYVGHWMADE